MNQSEAKSTIVREGTSEDGMVAEIRGRSEFPSQDRLATLIEALEATKATDRGASHIERDIAHALYCIGFHIQGHLDGMVAIGKEIDDIFIEDMIVIYDLIESILEGGE